MQFPAAQIALIVKGKIEGDPNTTVNSFGKIEEAKEGQLSFLANPSKTHQNSLKTPNPPI